MSPMDASLVSGGKARFSPRRLVKVFLHGEPFGRKINLSVHNSYDSLSFTLKRLGNNYSLSQFELSDLEISEEDGALDENNFVLLYDNADGERFFLGEVPWEEFTISVKKIYILPGEKEDDNADYLEDGDGYNGDVNAAAADGDEDAAGEDEADVAAVTEDGDGDGACDDEDVAVGEDEDDDVAEDGNDSSEE
ncbi:putative auxin-responsive protein IAA28 [Lolium perenne]|uniref:putative auxin-responsive protein IAA28 n=1 Tax=Lolium perenne TaxID=4522 RepID=UPI003A98DF82